MYIRSSVNSHPAAVSRRQLVRTECWMSHSGTAASERKWTWIWQLPGWFTGIRRWGRSESCSCKPHKSRTHAGCCSCPHQHTRDRSDMRTWMKLNPEPCRTLLERTFPRGNVLTRVSHRPSALCLFCVKCSIEVAARVLVWIKSESKACAKSNTESWV